jgi:hypothetical protein
MNYSLIGKLIADKFRDPSTYYVAAVVGTLINLYGQLLVPWFRSNSNPFSLFAGELKEQTELTLFSIFLAYAFPVCVGVYSAVASRYKNRRLESIADFPERKPDPVFRADRSGHLVEVGAKTQALFDKHDVQTAQTILGSDIWEQLLVGDLPNDQAVINFESEGARYLVAYAPTHNDQINIYLTRVPKAVGLV